MNEVKPYNTSKNKKAEVEVMFDNIAANYDLLNRVLSFGIDKAWRKKLIKMIAANKPHSLLDVATGTGDVAILAAKQIPDIQITGVDLSQKMIDIGKKKLIKLGLDNILLTKGESESLPFDSQSFDAVTVAFGVRNFGDLDKGLSELNRVLNNHGHVGVLEFSKPKSMIFSKLYNFYFQYILPKIGNYTSKDMRAYTYLYESVQQFPDGQAFIDRLSNAGFKNIQQKRLFSGICTIYIGQK